MTCRSPSFRYVPGIICSLALATALPAATIVPLSDEALVDTAPVILVGRVEGKLPPLSAALETEWLITVERVLKADRFVGGSLVLVTPGGVNAQGEQAKVFGAPAFRRGEQVLLFVRPRGDRFAVEMTWRNQYNDTSGTGIPTRLSNLTGAFSFTSRANLETLIKVLEFPDRFLVLYGALSNLEYTFQLRDTVTGRTETYHNPAGRYCGGLDNSAF